MRAPLARKLSMWNPGVIPVFVSVRGDTSDGIERYWTGVTDGATVVQPLGPAGWSPSYGMLTDRFGVTWVLDVQSASSRH